MQEKDIGREAPTVTQESTSTAHAEVRALRTDHGERLARLEQALEHLATKADIEALRVLIIERENVTLRWLMGMAAAAGLTVAIAMVRMFVS